MFVPELSEFWIVTAVGELAVEPLPTMTDETAKLLDPTKGWRVRGIERSPITGPEGNVEFLIAADREQGREP